MKKTKPVFHMLFEQSNTFRDTAISLGYQADSYDIEGNPSKKVDLFDEIIHYGAFPTIFDSFDQNDIVIAFFPCTYFKIQNLLIFQGTQKQLRDFNLLSKLEHCRSREFKRARYYDYLCQLMQIALMKGFKLIVENPYTDNYLLKWLPLKPALVMPDRTIYGDSAKKPTMFYFINCEPRLFVPEFKSVKPKWTVSHSPFGIKRSLISKDFAKIFIRDFILGGSENE